MASKLWLNNRQSDNELIGLVVYRPYRPTRVGRVLDVLPDRKEIDPGDRLLRVLWLNGTVESVWSGDLSDFIELMEDHRKKLETHQKRLDALERAEYRYRRQNQPPRTEPEARLD